MLKKIALFLLGLVLSTSVVFVTLFFDREGLDTLRPNIQGPVTEAPKPPPPPPAPVTFGPGVPGEDPCSFEIDTVAAEKLLHFGIEDWVEMCKENVAAGKAPPMHGPMP